MFYIHPTEKWIDEVVRLLNETQLKPDSSKFMIAFFSSLDNEYVDYFKNNKERISSYSGKNFHIFTPLIYEGNTIPDDDWRYMRHEFKSMGIPLQSDPTLLFFSLEGGGIPRSNDGWRTYEYRPAFFAGFTCVSFREFPTKLKRAIDACIEIDHAHVLAQRLTEIFRTENLIHHDMYAQLSDTISRRLPRSTVFVSHSSKDKAFVRRLLHELGSDPSLRLWIDENEIHAGADVQRVITQSLRPTDTDWLLLVISEHSTESSWVNFEVSQFIGFANGNNIIPVILTKDCHFPEPIDNLIRRLRYVDFSDEAKWKHGIEDIKRTLHAQAGR